MLASMPTLTETLQANIRQAQQDLADAQAAQRAAATAVGADPSNAAKVTALVDATTAVTAAQEKLSALQTALPAAQAGDATAAAAAKVTARVAALAALNSGYTNVVTLGAAVDTAVASLVTALQALQAKCNSLQTLQADYVWLMNGAEHELERRLGLLKTTQPDPVRSAELALTPVLAALGVVSLNIQAPSIEATHNATSLATAGVNRASSTLADYETRQPQP